MPEVKMQGNVMGSSELRQEHSVTYAHDVTECTAHLVRTFLGHLDDSALSIPDGCDLQMIEESLNRVVNQIHAVRMNRSSPIMRFPPEILLHIFRMVQHSDVELRRHSGQIRLGSTNKIYDFSSRWITITHVCRHWRYVALYCPSLWSTISTTYPCPKGAMNPDAKPQAVAPEFLRVCLERSGQVPISVQIQSRNRNRPWETSRRGTVLLPHISRCKELHICTYRLGDDSCDVLIKMKSAPSLETLALHQYPALDRPHAQDMPLLFQGDTGSVKYLAFSGYRGFSGRHYGNLRQLHISQQVFDTRGMQFLLDALTANPLLEDLMFTQITFPALDTISAPFNHYPMPCLRRLVFDGSAHTPLQSYTPFLACLGQHPAQWALSASQAKPSLVDVSGSHLCDVFTARVMDLIVIPQFDSISLAFHHDKYMDVLCTGPSAAWYLCGFQRQAQVGTAACEVPAVRQLWVTFESSYIQQETESPAILCWPSTHSFRELIINVRTHKSDGYRWFFSSFNSTELGLPYASLDTIYVFGTDPALWELLKDLAQSRKELNHPIRFLHFYLARNTAETTEEERLLFDDWGRRAPEELRGCEEVEFREVNKYPRLMLPQICSPHEDGRWKWFDWSSLGEW